MRLIEIPSRRSLGGFDMRYLLMLGIAIGATGEPTVEVGQAPNPKEAMLEATETPFGTNRRRLCDSCSGDDAHCDCNCACVARVDRPGYVYVPDYIAQYGTYWYQTTDDATGYSDQSEAEAACTSDRNCAGVAERRAVAMLQPHCPPHHTHYIHIHISILIHISML